MSEGIAQRIEAWVDAGASALLGAAVWYAASAFGLPILLSAGWGTLAFLLCFWKLGSVDAEGSSFRMQDFAPAPFEPDPLALALDDAAEAGEESRVVRLFDPSTASQAAPPDASEAFYEALATLRHSLR